MVMPTVLRLDEVRAGDGGQAGGKAAKLGELAGKGFPVPPGFVIPAGVSREVFARLGLGRAVAGLEGAASAALAERCQAVQRRIVAGEMDGAVATSIREAHARLVGERNVACAVRSSATAEDLADASFAGQHGTYYYVDAARLLEMVQRCWASLFSAEAVSYRTTHGIPHGSVGMAVLVQEMVESEVSGVAFTANPVTGGRGEIVIEASWGMGAAIVDGRVTPDRYVLERPGLAVRERRIAEKRFMVPTSLPDERAERLVAVPHEQRRREALSADQVQAVAGWSLRCEEHFGAPQDVEWALAGGRLHVLQSRPITTLDRIEIGRGVKGKYVLAKPLAENFTDPLTPFTADLFEGSFPPGFRLIGGRLYINLDTARPLFPFVLTDEELADLMYSIGRPATPLRLSPARLPVTAAIVLSLYLVLAMVLARTRGLPDDFMEGYRDLCREVEATDGLGLIDSMRRLWLLPRIYDSIGRMPIFVNVTAVPRAASSLALLEQLLRRWLPELGLDAVSRLCAGGEGVLSAEMGRAIRDLAQEAGREPAVRALLLGQAPEAAMARLATEPAAAAFRKRLADFLAVHGHRALREFELRSPRWDEDPTPVVGMIRNYLRADSGALAPEETAARARRELEQRIHQSLAGRPLGRARSWLVRRVAARARHYLKLRENSRFYHIMGIGSLRKKVLARETALRAQGRLKCKDDIFFLHVDEVVALGDGGLEWRDVEDRIRERRIEHVRLAKATPPRTLGLPPRPEPPPSAEDERLLGQSASPGRYTGRARVILDPAADVTLEPGEVLVAPYTDPAWTPLFLTAGAAVVEVGSYLSHAGTVAREFGMPCVVDVADCTRRIQPGDRLEVDGSAGVVRILSRSTSA